VWSGTVEAVEVVQDRVRVLVAGAPPVLAEVTPEAVAALGLRPGEPVWVSVKAAEVDVYPR
jgi:molybdate transport system ATP-binding protein